LAVGLQLLAFLKMNSPEGHYRKQLMSPPELETERALQTTFGVINSFCIPSYVSNIIKHRIKHKKDPE
jgi:hypothetical protein